MLPEPQQRCLAEIEDQLRLSDSQLTYRFSLFAELVAGQEMPRRERLPLTLRARMALLGRIAGWRSHAAGGGSPSRALLLLPALLAVIMCALLLVAAPRHGGPGCSGQPGAVQMSSGGPAGWAASCPARLPSARHR